MINYKEIINSAEIKQSSFELSDKQLQKLKNVLLSALQDICEVCKKNDIDVMLIGGSALGSVRHNGYIPWDDDLDIAMSRKDFEKFKSMFRDSLGDKYILDAPNYSKKPSNRFPKVLIKNTKYVEVGSDLNDKRSKIKVDIFIIENIPTNVILRYIKGINCTLLMFVASNVQFWEEDCLYVKKMFCKSRQGRKLYCIKKVLGFLFSWKSSSKWFNCIDKCCQYKKKTRLMGIPSGRGHYFGEICDKDTFFPVSKGIFEQYEVNLPGNVDSYLKNLYGNYMAIPPVEKREKHSLIKIEFNDE